MPSVTAIILTHNESLHIARAIVSLRGICENVFVVDSFSSDNTVFIAESLGAKVIQRPFLNYAEQFQWAMDNLPFRTEWLMRLDADEYLENRLREELLVQLQSTPQEVTGINLKRKHVFMGRWIRFGGRYPLTLLRLWRTGSARIEARWMDEHIVLLRGSTLTAKHPFADHNLKDLSFFTAKHNGYATREAIDVILNEMPIRNSQIPLSAKNTSLQVKVTRTLKASIYNKLPFEISSLLYFVFRYFFQLGFLDGRPGVIYHFLQAFWYRFLVGSKIVELRRALAPHQDSADRIKELSRLTGHKIEDFQS